MATKSAQQSQAKGNETKAEQSTQSTLFWKDMMGKFDMGGFYQEALKYVDDASKAFSFAKMPGLNVDQMAGFQKRGVEVLSSTQQMAYDHLLSMGRQQMEVTQKFVEGMNTLAQMIYGGQSIEVCVSKQIDNTKQVVEQTCGAIRNLGTKTQKLTERTVEVFGQYLNQNLDEAQQLLNTVK